ncbi:hypothetical protein V491_08554, partial [Pseudogymnoascus sp. VKM F-3775]
TDNGVRAEESKGARQLPIDQPVPQGDAPTKNIDKPVKHVRVQSPPPSSPEDAIEDKPHTALPQGDEGHALGHDPFESIASDESSDDNDEEIPPISGVRNDGRAPMNPFSKTLATLEGTEGKKPASEAPPTGTAKAAMDVESFKRLLMTGNSGIKASESLPTPPTQPAQGGPTDGSSTEASSVSRHSIFENIQENLPESPRTSHEASDADDDRRRLQT